MRFKEGYWMWYIESIKNAVQRPLAKIEYSNAMDAYINGTKWEKHVLTMPSETPPEPVEKRKRFT